MPSSPQRILPGPTLRDDSQPELPEDRQRNRTILASLVVTTAAISSVLISSVVYKEPPPFEEIAFLVLSCSVLWLNLDRTTQVDREGFVRTYIGPSMHISQVSTSSDMRWWLGVVFVIGATIAAPISAKSTHADRVRRAYQQCANESLLSSSSEATRYPLLEACMQKQGFYQFP